MGPSYKREKQVSEMKKTKGISLLWILSVDTTADYVFVLLVWNKGTKGILIFPASAGSWYVVDAPVLSGALKHFQGLLLKWNKENAATKILKLNVDFSFENQWSVQNFQYII